MQGRVFVSERIVNINELEQIIDSLKTNFIFLKRAIEKTAPSDKNIDDAVAQINIQLEKASNFEFLLEHRKCVIKDDADSPRNAGNP